MMETGTDLAELVGELDAAKRTLDLLMFDEDLVGTPANPCSPSELARVESILGATLPPSYRRFLELHNGWPDFAGEARILSSQDLETDWVRDRIKSLGFLFEESENPDPFKSGGMPVVLGVDEQSYLVMEPWSRRDDGEMELVAYNLTLIEHRFETFEQFLRHDLELTNRLIEEEELGSEDDGE